MKKPVKREIERDVKIALKRDVIQHVIYGLIIIAIVTGIVFYENKITVETRNMLSQEVEQLTEQLSTTETLLNKVSDNVDTLNAQLEQKNVEIRSLTGELDVLKVESAKQLSDLEEQVTGLKSEFKDFSEVIDVSLPAVVSVRTNVGLGSGFLVHGDGYVVTNYHVIDGARAATIITSDAKDHAVRLVGGDRSMDIAVLKIEGKKLPRLNWGDSNSLRAGEKVIAVGNPGGLDFTVTQGIISAVNRIDAQGRQLIQIDVPINPGNSGGPLINTAGRVVGVNTLKIAGFEGVGFALSEDYVRGFVDDLISGDE